MIPIDKYDAPIGYIAVQDLSGCSGCAFQDRRDIDCSGFNCISSRRKDSNVVVFVEDPDSQIKDSYSVFFIKTGTIHNHQSKDDVISLCGKMSSNEYVIVKNPEFVNLKVSYTLE